MAESSVVDSVVSFDLKTLREREFPELDRGGDIYLNSASTGPIPTRTVQALDEWMQRRQRPQTIRVEDEFAVSRLARERCAALIGADVEEIALSGNTSGGVNLAARTLPLGAGDVIVASEGEFPANVYPWMAVARARGAELRLIPRAGAWPDEEALLAALDDPAVRVLAVSWVSFSTGYRVELARLGAACRERGVYLAVDAIQGVGAAELDVHACQVDFLACGGQKWLLSPWGTGFTYVRRELVEQLEPPAAGWLSVKGAETFSRLMDYDLTWYDDARRFEVGTLPCEILAAMGASLSLPLEIGMPEVARRVAMLAGRIVAWAESNPSVRLLTPSDPARRAGIVAFVPPDVEGVAGRLADAKVSFSLRLGGVRLAPHYFNTVAEVDAALRAIEG